MISSIYIMSFTLQMNYYDEKSFHELLIQEIPKYVDHHIPRGASFASIEYLKDELVTAFIEKVVEKWLPDIKAMKKKGIEMNIGVYKIQLEGEDDYSQIPLHGIEYLFQEMHKHFSFIGSLFLYLLDDEFQFYVRLHTFESDEDDTEGLEMEAINEYADLFQHYFYEEEIPECWSSEAALMLLTERKL